MADVRFGLVGYGAWGSHHAAAIAQTAGAKLAAIVSRSEASRETARRDHPDCDVCSDYRELAAREDLDVIDVVVPSDLHFEVASAMLEGGKHLLLEKPMALTLADCDRLIELARSRQRLFAVGHELRLSSLWGRVKDMIDSGLVGEPRYVLIELWRRPYRHGSQDWRYNIDRVGNWILEEPIHFFDLVRWYLAGVGEPQAVFARASSRQPGHPELTDNFTAVVEFPGDCYATVSQTLAAFEHHQVAKITGTEGAIWASWSGAMDRTLHPTFWLKHFDGNEVHEIKLDKITGEVFELQDQMAMMVAAVRDGGSLAATGEDGRCSVALCLAAQESVDQRRRIVF